MLILNKTRINILVDVHFLIPTFQVVLIHINKVGNRINKVGHETTKWVNESTKWVNKSTSWTASNQPGGLRQLYENPPGTVKDHKNQPVTMKDQPGTIKTQPGTMKKPTWNRRKP